MTNKQRADNHHSKGPIARTVMLWSSYSYAITLPKSMVIRHGIDKKNFVLVEDLGPEHGILIRA